MRAGIANCSIRAAAAHQTRGRLYELLSHSAAWGQNSLGEDLTAGSRGLFITPNTFTDSGGGEAEGRSQTRESGGRREGANEDPSTQLRCRLGGITIFFPPSVFNKETTEKGLGVLQWWRRRRGGVESGGGSQIRIPPSSAAALFSTLVLKRSPRIKVSGSHSGRGGGEVESNPGAAVKRAGALQMRIPSNQHSEFALRVCLEKSRRKRGFGVIQWRRKVFVGICDAPYCAKKQSEVSKCSFF